MPSRPVRAVAAVALATSATSFAYVGSVAPAQAAGYNGVCKTSSGVTVVVDFRELGGGIAVRCAPVGSGASGVDALQAAGIPAEGTRQYGLAFICRLYGKPSATATLPGGYHESCGRTPPPNAHWWYTQAPNGGSWSSSGDGASTSHVIPGGFEGWAFSEGGTNYSPRYTPTRPAAPKPPPAPTHTTTQPPAPPRHTTTTAPSNPKTTDPNGNSTSSKAGSTHSQPKSTTASKASQAAKKKAAEKKAKASHSSSASSSSKAKRSKGSSSSAGVTGTSSGGPTNVAGAPMANSDDLIKDSKKSSGVNATTVVGGGVLAALVVGGGAVAIVRRRN
ncbi:hypothetical protein [Flexivirga alba]|uniref:Gram-positive cocci surface proteins LPxTG domain-containing protein n=1 Tax=Flexivirga alba TaxID=702742 RepID=A0ABW2AC88_9MICO